MDLLADENADTKWALRDDDHDVARVVDLPELGVGTPDPEVITVATRQGRTLLTSDRSNFADPPIDSHAGVVAVVRPERPTRIEEPAGLSKLYHGRIGRRRVEASLVLQVPSRGPTERIFRAVESVEDLCRALRNC